MATASPDLVGQLAQQRRSVDFDTFDIVLQQIVSMVKSKAIDIAPAYQRQFRWDNERCSELVESIFLGIPVPSLFMAANTDGTWELVDGVQRLSSIVKFVGDDELRTRMGVGPALRLEGLEKLSQFNAKTFLELPESIRLQFELRPIKVVTLSDKSDSIVRFDLFERLNTGGIALTEQEIRACVFRGSFADFLGRLAADQNFHSAVKLTNRQDHDGTREECVLRFFAYLHRYKQFVHSVAEFLNDYMKEAMKSFDQPEGDAIFKKTFLQLAGTLKHGIVRPTRKGITPLVLFEGVAVGAALAIKQAGKLKARNVETWLASQELRDMTTGATNSPAAVRGRIEFCRDRFLGR
jgi:Protein of unknown function DUF262